MFNIHNPYNTIKKLKEEIEYFKKQETPIAFEVDISKLNVISIEVTRCEHEDTDEKSRKVVISYYTENGKYEQLYFDYHEESYTKLLVKFRASQDKIRIDI